jgi:hypothetical protein
LLLFAAVWFVKPALFSSFELRGRGSASDAGDSSIVLLHWAEIKADLWPNATIESVTIEGCLLAAAPTTAGAEAGDAEDGRTATYCPGPTGSAYLVRGANSSDNLVLNDTGAGSARPALISADGLSPLSADQALPQRITAGETATLVLLWELDPSLASFSQTDTSQLPTLKVVVRNSLGSLTSVTLPQL